MNEKIGKVPILSDEDCEKIRMRFLKFKEETKQSWRDLARQMTVFKDGQTQSISQGTLSAWGTGNYNAPAHWIADGVLSFFNAIEKNTQTAALLPLKIGFIQTETAEKIQNQLYWASLGKITTTIGDPGLGKTESLRDYCAKTPNSWTITLSPTRRALKAVLLELLRVMDIKAEAADVRVLSNQIRDYLRGRGGVIAIDEAQNLSELAIEELRAIHDDTKVGMAFVGNREVIQRLEGNRREAAYAQRFSRNTFSQYLEIPTQNDVKMILDAWGIDCQKSIDLLTNIAMRKGGGTLRTISNTLELATVIANRSHKSRNFDLIKDAYLQTHQNDTGVR